MDVNLRYGFSISKQVPTIGVADSKAMGSSISHMLNLLGAKPDFTESKRALRRAIATGSSCKSSEIIQDSLPNCRFFFRPLLGVLRILALPIALDIVFLLLESERGMYSSSLERLSLDERKKIMRVYLTSNELEDQLDREQLSFDSRSHFPPKNNTTPIFKSLKLRVDKEDFTKIKNKEESEA